MADFIINIVDTRCKDFVHGQHYPARPKNHWTPAPWSKKRKTWDYAKDRVSKYARYFQKDRIMRIPELVEAVRLKTLSFVILDLRTGRLTGLKKETFEELLKTMSVFLQAKFHHVGRLAALGGSSQKKFFSSFSPNIKATGELRFPCATSRSGSMEMSSLPTLAIMVTWKKLYQQDRQPGEHTGTTYLICAWRGRASRPFLIS